MPPPMRLGTAKAIAEAGLPVTNVSDVTGFPEMMDGRVKTLHPNVFGGILWRRSHPADAQTVAERNIPSFDLVIVDLYPFEETARKNSPFSDLIENIDIGGPSLIRAAAKNYKFVSVVTDVSDYEKVLSEISELGDTTIEDRIEPSPFVSIA